LLLETSSQPIELRNDGRLESRLGVASLPAANYTIRRRGTENEFISHAFADRILSDRRLLILSDPQRERVPLRGGAIQR
jgi:hypothetical protein